jgi:hypothetical protein
MDMKGMVEGHSDATILAEAARGEDGAVRAYESALQTELPPSAEPIVRSQFLDVKDVHDRVKALEEEWRRRSTWPTDARLSACCAVATVIASRPAYRRYSTYIDTGPGIASDVHVPWTDELCAEGKETGHPPQLLGHLFSDDAEVAFGLLVIGVRADGVDGAVLDAARSVDSGARRRLLTFASG